MFQREVAERIVADAGQRDDYGRLGVLARLAHARRRSCSTCRRRLHAAAQGDLGGRPPRPRPDARAVPVAGAGGVTPPPSASAARCCARASSRSAPIRCRCSRRRASSRRAGRRRCRSPASSRSPTRWRLCVGAGMSGHLARASKASRDLSPAARRRSRPSPMARSRFSRSAVEDRLTDRERPRSRSSLTMT